MMGEATAIAEKRGDVIPVPGGRSDAFDLIICEELRNVFVRFRRTSLDYFGPEDIHRAYRRDIARLVRMPLTRVMAREFWLRLPNGEWQFFLVRHDSIVEVREDGTIRNRPVQSIPVRDTAAADGAGAGEKGGAGGGPGSSGEGPG
jgi:hypothetical protein